MPTGEQYLDIHEVAKRVGLSTKTIRRKVKAREFSIPFMFGGGWRWLESDVDRWMLRTAVENAIDPDSLADEETTVEDRGHSGTSPREAGDSASNQKKSR